MSGLFEHLAATEDLHRVASRKALALARARASKRFANFLDAAQTVTERESRLALVAGDLTETVKQACADCDYDDWEGVLASVQERLGMIVEARRPKMCPFHREVTDISLQSGDPQSGFSAMSPHTFGEQSCRGNWDGRCNFKPEMTTQSYWDRKNEESEARRQQREEQKTLELQTFEDPATQDEFIDEVSAIGQGEGPLDTADTSQDFDFGQGGSQAEPQMAMAASTRIAMPPGAEAPGVEVPGAEAPGAAPVGGGAVVPNPLIHQGTLEPLALIESKKPGLMIDGQPFQQFYDNAMQQMQQTGSPQLESLEVSHPNPTWENIAADILREGNDGPLNKFMQEARARRQQQAGPQGPQAGGGPAVPPTQASFRNAEALKTVDVAQGSESPSPKMDKRKWTPDNVNFIDAEMDGSPHPTEHQDIAQPASFSDEDWDVADYSAVLEHQDVEKKWTRTPGTGGTFPKGNQVNPVTSAIAFPQEGPPDSNHPAGAACPGCGAPGYYGECRNCGFQEVRSDRGHEPGGQHVNEHWPSQNLPADTPRGRWGGAPDPDKNPIRESLEAEFPSEDEVQQALAAFHAGVPNCSVCGGPARPMPADPRYSICANPQCKNHGQPA